MRRRVADYPLVAIALLLSAFGVAMVFSAGQTDVPTAVQFLWERQLLWLAIGIVAAFLASRASVRLMDWMTTPVFVISCVVLLILLFVGKGAKTGVATRTRRQLDEDGTKERIAVKSGESIPRAR